MASGEGSAPSALFRLDSIKSKITIYALVATLLPSLTMGLLFYFHNKQVYEDKIEQGLKNATLNAARDAKHWLSDRQHELRVFANSYLVAENLDNVSRRGVLSHRANVGLEGYLKSVQTKLEDHVALMVCDTTGTLIASSEGSLDRVDLPAGFLNTWSPKQAEKAFLQFDRVLGQAVLILVEPVRNTQEEFLGVLAAKLGISGLVAVLQSNVRPDIDELYLVDEHGRLIASSAGRRQGFLSPMLSSHASESLFVSQLSARSFVTYDEKMVMGTAKKLAKSNWGVVGQLDIKKAYAPIVKLRNLTLGIVSCLMVIIGLIAYVLGLSIVRPLNRLTRGAGQVASGDLEVDLPVLGRGEVSYLTRVFNHMVSRLRANKHELEKVHETLIEKNAELEALSITDNLTGLFNRNRLIEALESETLRSQRNEKTFVILLIDIDHFKQHNDRHGHLAGDEVLRTLGTLLKNSIRACDIAARYGGEEFLLILPEIGLTQGMKTAERIRKLVSSESFKTESGVVHITVSIGVATFPIDGEKPDELFLKADKALYRAKASGRNKVVAA